MSAKLTRESFEAGIQAIIEEPEYPQPEHVMHPRAWKGEWTPCTCGWAHRIDEKGEMHTWAMIP